MQQRLLLLCAVFTGLACNNPTRTDKEKSITAGDNVFPQEDSFPTPPSKDTVPQNIQIDSVIHLAFAADSFSVSVKGHIDKKGDPVICYLPVTSGKKLEASIVPDKKRATFRFSHIYLPDGKSDGPFGNAMKYDLKQKGTYKIYIGPNMMAGDPVSSDFILRVKVK
jgi:hypothetical protein